jgi:hypothetical protein
MIRLSAALLCAAATIGLGACGNGGSGASGLSTASILGEAPASVSGDRPGAKAGDPMARPIQVAWTAARAERCGFNFDPGRLRANYLAFEQSEGADAARVASVGSVYDQTVVKTKASIGKADEYCTDAKAKEIKADLTRHLAGNYEPKVEKQVAGGGWFSTDKPVEDKFDPKTIWQDIEDRRNGVRR